MPRAMLVCAAGAVWGTPAAALEWRSEHAVAAGVGSESNLGLNPIDPVDAQNATVSVSTDVLARRPGLSLQLRPEVRAQRYADDAQADRNDAFATAALDLDNRRRRFALDASYARESTLTSEFESGGLLGRLDVERAQRATAATYARSLRGGHALELTAADVDTSYGSGADPNSTFGDFGVRSIDLLHSVATGERSSRNIVARKSFVDQAATTRSTTTTELNASWSARLSPYLQGTVGVGAYVVARPEAEPEDPSALLNLSLSRSWPRWTFSTAAARSLRPETGGVVVVEDSLSIGAQRRLGERLTVGLQVRGGRSSSALAGPFDYERTYSSAGATLSWRVARRIDVNASIYERTEDTTFTRRASSLASSVSLSYRSG